MEILIGVAIGIVSWNILVYGRYKIHQRRKHKRVIILTNYDSRIDKLTSSGLMRYKIHKAMTEPERRAALQGQPFYEEAVKTLSWND